MNLPPIPITIDPSPVVQREYGRLCRVGRRIDPSEREAFLDDLGEFVRDATRCGGWLDWEVEKHVRRYRESVVISQRQYRNNKRLADRKDVRATESAMFEAIGFKNQLMKLTQTVGTAGEKEISHEKCKRAHRASHRPRASCTHAGRVCQSGGGD